MQRQSGFTLIELVVVIVILGILAAVAAPKFIDISVDARKATLEGVKAAVKSGNSLLYSKSILEGSEKQSNDDRSTKTIADINVHYGEVLGNNVDVAALLDLDLDVSGGNTTAGDWQFANNGSGVVEIRPADVESDSVCYVQYTEAEDALTKAKVVVDSSTTTEC